MRYLVTGSAGFIGFHLARRLLEPGHFVVGIDAMNACYDDRLKHARRFSSALAAAYGFAWDISRTSREPD